MKQNLDLFPSKPIYLKKRDFLKFSSPVNIDQFLVKQFFLSLEKNSVQLVKNVRYWPILLLNYGAMNPLLPYLAIAQPG